MKAKLLFTLATLLFVCIGYFKNNMQSKGFYIAALLSIFFVLIYLLFTALKKPFSERLGVIHATFSIIGLLLIAYNFHSLVISPVAANTSTAASFAADIKIIFKNIAGFLFFTAAQIMFLLSVVKKRN